MSESWNLAFILPNVSFKDPIENEWLALVPYSDSRFGELASNSVAVQKLRDGFQDQFGSATRPSALIIHQDAPKSVDLYAVISFRNAIAIASTIDAWSLKISGGNAGYPLWTDYFDFYRFTATKDGTDLIGRSLAAMTLNSANDFLGQSSPHLANSNAVSFGIDKEVLDFLLAHWKKGFLNKVAPRQTRVVLRSLEVSFHAARMPAVGSHGTTIHDMGVSIGLWVSAFEILTHPKKGNANLGTVEDCLGKVNLQGSKVNAKRFKLRYGGKTQRVNFVQHMYKSLYDARNDFMHGNRVREVNAFPFKNQKLPHLQACAPLIYRVALGGIDSKKVARKSKNLQKELERFFMSQLRNRPFRDALDKLYECYRSS